jgi:hypothetical protein
MVLGRVSPSLRHPIIGPGNYTASSAIFGESGGGDVRTAQPGELLLPHLSHGSDRRQVLSRDRAFKLIDFNR